MVESNHRCFVQTANLDTKREPTMFVYDFESDVVTNEYHKPISVSWLQVGDTVDNIQYLCGWDTVDQFARLVCTHRNSIWVAHNARSYDSVLLRPALERMAGIKLSVVRSGQKLMLMSIPRLGIRFYDSLNHISDRLANLPKTFGYDVHLTGPTAIPDCPWPLPSDIQTHIQSFLDVKHFRKIKVGAKTYSPDDGNAGEICETLLLPATDDYDDVYETLKTADNLDKGYFPYRFPYTPGYVGELPAIDQ